MEGIYLNAKSEIGNGTGGGVTGHMVVEHQGQGLSTGAEYDCFTLRRSSVLISEFPIHNS
jgi:hypothetical protein